MPEASQPASHDPRQLTVEDPFPLNFDRFEYLPDRDTQFDWRSRGWTAPSLDQYGRGSCVSNSGCRMMEAVALRRGRTISLEATEFHNCVVGFPHDVGPLYSSSSLRLLEQDGAPFRRQGSYPPAGPCPAPATRRIKLIGLERQASDEEVKLWVLRRSPVVAAIEVGPLFEGWRGNAIFTGETGGDRYAHAVLITGYDDIAGCWMIQNSRGLDWGDGGGFARIAYGSCRLLSDGRFSCFGCTDIGSALPA